MLFIDNVEYYKNPKNSSSNKKEKERMEYTSSELSDADPDSMQLDFFSKTLDFKQ